MKVKDGMIGLIVGDALGVPVEFESRATLKENPVTGMMGYGTYGQQQALGLMILQWHWLQCTVLCKKRALTMKT